MPMFVMFGLGLRVVDLHFQSSVMGEVLPSFVKTNDMKSEKITELSLND